MRKTLTAVVTTAALLLAAPVRADENDAEDRFHKAYEAEVVGGKLADAARTYLDLMRDEKVPARLRAEAKFRFAVTAVLLGRPDEARAHFAELKADASLPETLRARAAEYLDTARGIGVGSELDKRMQALVFDLGRVPETEAKPAPYRDFEIIGKPAIPFLRGLLSHADAAVRTHAFRLLLRLDAPGMAQAWSPEISLRNGWIKGEVREYLLRHDEEAAQFDGRLRAMDDAGLARLLTDTSFYLPVSADLLRAAGKRGIPSTDLARLSYTAFSRPGGTALRDEWLRSDDAVLARAATFSMLGSARNETPPVAADLATLRTILARLTGLGFNWRLSTWRTQPAESRAAVGGYREADGLAALAGRLPIDDVLALLDETVAAGEGWKADARLSPLVTGIADAFAVAVEDAKPSAAALTRYADLLIRWAAAATAAKATDPALGLPSHLSHVLLQLPRAEAEALVARLVTGPSAAAAGSWVRALPTESAEHFALSLAAYRAATRNVRFAILAQQAELNTGVAKDPARAAAILAAMPEVTPDLVGVSSNPLAAVPALARAVPAEQAGAALIGIAKAIAAHPDLDARLSAIEIILVPQSSRNSEVSARYVADVVAPVAEPMLSALGAPEREKFVRVVAGEFTTCIVAPARERLAALVRAHVEDANQEVLQWMFQAPDVFPLAEWVPRAKAQIVAGAVMPMPAETVSAALAKMAPDPARANASVRAFLRRAAPAEIQAAFYDRVLRGADMTTLAEAVGELRPRNATPNQLAVSVSVDALESAIDRAVAACAASPLPPWLLRNLVGMVLTQHPSERLFPAIRLLLASPDRGDVLDGIAAAQSLGRADLLPALADKLDSLDVTVRNAARGAIASINQLEAMRLAKERRAAGLPPGPVESVPPDETPPK